VFLTGCLWPQYRICPANSKLDEECFQKRPLKFVGQGSLRWGGIGGEQIFFNASDTSVGTTPAGSTWRKCPIPRGPCRVISDCHFRKTATEYDRKPGIKWLSCTAT
jgi:hypothetical protein